MKPNIYLDVDGVLQFGGRPTKHAAEFIKFVVANYPTYWLTTRCQGDATKLVEYLGTMFDAETMNAVHSIEPTNWDMAKTRAIDFTKPFLWFDDNLMYEEKETLLAHDALDNWIGIDIREDPEQLGKLLADFPLPVTDN